MRLFFVALVLIFMFSFPEIEASGLKKLFTKKKSKDNEDIRNILATPRPQTLTAPTEYPISGGHQALNLHKFHPYILESSQRSSSAELHPCNLEYSLIPTSGEASDQVNRLKKNKASSSKGAPSSRRIRNDQIEQTKTKESLQNQRELRMQNASSSRDDVDASKMNVNDSTESGYPRKKYGHITADLKEAERMHRLPLSQPSEIIQLKPFLDNQPLDFRKLHREKEALNLFNLYYPDGHPEPQTQYSFQYQPQSVNEDMRESSYRLFQSHYPHGVPKPEPQLAFYDHEAHSFNKDMDENNYRLFQDHYPYGLSDHQPHTSSGNRLPALHERDDSITLGGYQRRTKKPT